MQGVVLEVSERPRAYTIATDVLAGASILTLTTVEDLPQPLGELEIDGGVYSYSEVDPESGIVTLNTPLALDLFDADIIHQSPRVIEKWAIVELQASNDAILALVPHGLWDRIPEGVRVPEDQESVVIAIQEGDWVILDIIGSQPLMDGTFIDPATAPTAAEVTGALDDLAAQVITNATDIVANESAIENASATAFAANSLASTADGRISISDYDPAPEDVSYTARDINGNPILGADGLPVVLTRNEGSIWFTRTRNRRNYVTNPSFETNVTDWTAQQCSVLREASAAIAGAYTMKVTNNGTPGDHYVTWDGGGGANKQPAAEGQVWTASVYALWVSGGTAGLAGIELEFFDASSVSLGFTAGPTAALTATWRRYYATATAPASAAFVVAHVSNPNDGAVWHVDGALLELGALLGRYFDGRSYDGSWDGTPDDSASVLAGGKVTRAWELDDGSWVEKFFTGSVLQDIDAASITHGVLDGERLGDYSVPMDKLAGTPVVASEALALGDFVNLHNVGELFRMRKASATSGYPADGYVLAAVASGAIGFYYAHGYNAFVAGLTPGPAYLSTVAGKAQSNPSLAVGTINQRIGSAGGATVLAFTPGIPVYMR